MPGRAGGADGRDVTHYFHDDEESARAMLQRMLSTPLGTQGGDPVTVAMNFDADRPVAMVPVDDGIVPYEDYFSSAGSVKVPAGNSAEFLIDGNVAQQAHTFHLAATYQQGGTKSTLFIQPAYGGPFRISPSICPEQTDISALTDEDIARSKTHRYDEVFQQAGTVADKEHLDMETITTDNYMRACTTM